MLKHGHKARQIAIDSLGDRRGPIGVPRACLEERFSLQLSRRIFPASNTFLTQASALATMNNRYDLATSDAGLSLSTERHTCLRGLGFMS